MNRGIRGFEARFFWVVIVLSVGSGCGSGGGGMPAAGSWSFGEVRLASESDDTGLTMNGGTLTLTEVAGARSPEVSGVAHLQGWFAGSHVPDDWFGTYFASGREITADALIELAQPSSVDLRLEGRGDSTLGGTLTATFGIAGTAHYSNELVFEDRQSTMAPGAVSESGTWTASLVPSAASRNLYFNVALSFDGGASTVEVRAEGLSTQRLVWSGRYERAGRSIRAGDLAERSGAAGAVTLAMTMLSNDSLVGTFEEAPRAPADGAIDLQVLEATRSAGT